MPDATELLSQDHRHVEQLFDQFEQSSDPAIARTVCEELEVHTTVEEELVYPGLREVDEEIAEHSQEEHDEADQIIQKVKKAEGDELRKQMKELRDSVEHHVQEEEKDGGAWQKLRDGKGQDWLQDVGARVESRKQELQDEVQPTKDELYREAKDQDVPGRSDMTKDELEKEVG
jgi:gas vesicle protein